MTDTVSNRSRWIGRLITAIPVMFLTFDTAIKLLRLPFAVEATAELGYPAGTVFVIGMVEAVCWALYLWPRTSMLAVLSSLTRFSPLSSRCCSGPVCRFATATFAGSCGTHSDTVSDS